MIGPFQISVRFLINDFPIWCDYYCCKGKIGKSMSTQFYNNIKTALLLGILTGIILLGGELIAGQRGLVIALIMAAGMNFASYFFSDRIALASAGAQEVGPDHPLYGIVERLAGRA